MDTPTLPNQAGAMSVTGRISKEVLGSEEDKYFQFVLDDPVDPAIFGDLLDTYFSRVKFSILKELRGESNV